MSDPRLTPARPDLAAEHLAGTVAAARYARPEPMIVSAPVLDLTCRADRNAPLDTQLLAGEVFAVYEIDPETGLAWGQCETDGYVGYVSVAGIEAADGPADCVVTALATHIYPEPTFKSRPLEALPMGARFAARAEATGFLEVATGGYVTQQHVAPAGRFAKDPVAVAARYLGLPYLWGGRSAFGLDCSALVQLSYAACGIALPRDSDLQETACAQRHGPPERGDLVFWDGHVGLMEDRATLLHANAHHMAVAREPLAEAARRIAANGGGEITNICRPPDLHAQTA
ncbi:MAG: NlpC/P60 family protein [Pseudomonadota bacterium]